MKNKIDKTSREYCKENANVKHSNEYGLMMGFRAGAEFIQKEVENEAIEFAVWCKSNYDIYFDKNTSKFKWGLSTGERYTTKQLYRMWKEENTEE